MMERIVLAVLVVLALGGPAAAQQVCEGPWQLGQAEYDRVRSCAEQGYAAAQNHLGLMYTNGLGVPMDDTEAARWFRLAAEQGYAAAQNNLGFLYNWGFGVKEDYAEALHWYRLAAEQGYAEAQYHLGNMYERGQGIPQDYVLAHTWFNIAAENGDSFASQLRDQLAQRMKPAQIAEAQRLAREWLEAHAP
jgi:TPR repeat protein